MTEIRMPRLSDSMAEGTILTWLKGDGEHVTAADELVEIETDKATMTYESPAEGVLVIAASEGETLAVGALIAHVGLVEDLASAPTEVVRNVTGTPVSETGATVREVALATPLARRMARLHGIDLAHVGGSGPRGRITRADVAAKAGIELAPTPEPAPTSQPMPAAPEVARDGPLPQNRPDVTVRELTRLQQTVARRMAEAKATVPEFQVQTEVAMDAAIAFRVELKSLGAEVSPSLNDLIVKACALALREHPRANGSYRDGRFELHMRVNIGIAVAAEDSLVVPTITDADMRPLGSIASEARRLAGRVRSGEITPPELSGATFTVSNLGMYGMTAIAPVINPPQAAILGVGATRSVPALVEGRLVERTAMTLTLICDHRILYGADAAKVLARIRHLLEQPLLLAL